jgi:hypothetical protein
MEANPNLTGGDDLIVEATPVREKIEMVGRCRAPTARKFNEADLGGDGDRIRCQSTPDWVESPQPVEQVRILSTWHRPREGLVQVVVGVDQARGNNVSPKVKDRVRGSRKICRWADHLNHAIAGKQTTVRNLGSQCVHGGKDGRVSNKQRLHDVNFAAKTKRRGAGTRRRPSDVDTQELANRLHCHRPPAVGTA